MTGKKYLKLPADMQKLPSAVSVKGECGQWDYMVSLSEGRVDQWTFIRLPPCLSGREIEIYSEQDNVLLGAAETVEELKEPSLRGIRFIFQYGVIKKIERIFLSEGIYWIKFLYTPAGCTQVYQEGYALTEDWVHWGYRDEAGCGRREDIPFVTDRQDYWYGSEGNIVTVFPGGNYEYQFLAGDGFSPVFRRKKNKQKVETEPVEGLEKLRVWKRVWEDTELVLPFLKPLHFRILPGRWPDIRIAEAEGTSSDIGGSTFEFCIEAGMGEESFAEFHLGQWKMIWENGWIKCGGFKMPLQADKGSIVLRGWMEPEWLAVLGENRVFFVCGKEKEKETERFSNDMTDNLSFCLEKEQEFRLGFCAGKTAVLKSAAAWGLRSIFWSEEERKVLSQISIGKKVFETAHYTIYENCIKDVSCGEPAAWVKGDGSIYSPLRVVEEFSWRKNIWGDMTRVVRRTGQWYPSYEQDAYPSVKSGIPVLDSACKLAFDTFYRCTRDSYALSGQKGMWNAGLFQGEGEGFGVWLRDTAHIALRMGSLADRLHARRSLLYISQKGISNGSDGAAMSQAGIWDYYLATGDKEILYEAWPALLQRTKEADGLYDSVRHLVKAGNAVSNDAFPEPENGGYALSAQVYYQQAYEAMGKMGRLINYREDKVKLWEEKAALMRESVQNLYWNEECGFFTCGPKSSEAYEKGFWETSGEESVLWPRFNIATGEQRRRILKKLPQTAMNDYGICLFPYRKEKNHLCNSIWYVWQAGFAAAASVEKDSRLLEMLLWQQVRSCVLNKEFYEVIDYGTGLAWRWPGQLWHAAGFLATVLGGAAGISYDEDGMRLSPCMPGSIKELEILNLPFRKAVYDIHIQGGEGIKAVYLDGQLCTKIPLDLEGRHILEVKR